MLNQAEIRLLIPHSGCMCLLDEVVSWNEKTIMCRTRSHLSPNNPLRHSDGLSAIHLIEYGAQAMAIHGGLLAKSRGSSARPGYLAAARQVTLHSRWMSDIDAELTVEAEQLVDDSSNFLYSFRVLALGNMLATGRATVITR